MNTDKYIKKFIEEKGHEPTLSDLLIEDDKKYTYRNIDFEYYNGRYIIIQNKHLLVLGISTPKTIQSGHKGYKSLATLLKRIDKGLGD